MHRKIDNLKQDFSAKIDDESLAEKLKDEEILVDTKYEKIFVTGNVGLSLLDTDKKESNGKKFKIIVEHGELFLECIDSFEEIFEIKKEMVENIELTSLLEPSLFDNHRDIINALF